MDVPIIPKEYKSNEFKHLSKGKSQTIHSDGLMQEKWSEEEEWVWQLYLKGRRLGYRLKKEKQFTIYDYIEEVKR